MIHRRKYGLHAHYCWQEERRQVEEADRSRKEKAERAVRRTAEEQAERNRLLGEYGYDSDPVDEDGNLPPEEGGDGEGATVRAWTRGKNGGGKLTDRKRNLVHRVNLRDSAAFHSGDVILWVFPRCCSQSRLSYRIDDHLKHLKKNV